jgi:hypothetical protein
VSGRARSAPDAWSILRAALFALAVLMAASVQAQSTVEVRYAEGLIRGFLVLRSMDGTVLAHGDLAQVSRDAGVKTHLVIRFEDGSIHDETVNFTQRDSFQLLSYRLVQKGPAFKVPLEMEIDRSTGEVVVRYADDNGKEKVERERMKLPANLMNGMIPILLKNIPPGAKKTTVSVIAATPKPRLVKMAISPEGEAKVLAGGVSHKVAQYRMKVEIRGILGMLAPLVGKQPQDSHAWILEGDAPAFVRLEGPLFAGGPSWRIEPSSPVWPEQ